jgi:hypothetical protein
MFGKLNHLAITSDRYTLLGMFYRAMFGLKASGDTAREIGAISVGDGYVGMTLIPGGRGAKPGSTISASKSRTWRKFGRKLRRNTPISKS